MIVNKTYEENKLSQALEVYHPAIKEATYYGVAQAIVDHIESKAKDVSYNELSVNFNFVIKPYLSRIVNLTIVDIDYLESICNNLFKLSHLAYQPVNIHNAKCFLGFIGLTSVISQATIDNINSNFDRFVNAYAAAKVYCEKQMNNTDK